ncbi:hypothetical protein [Promicromonospora sp. NPDC050262]|uniref:hypothetical protein n=1 Tax=Promicromonospora sp. NPDC050262 TaxID=3155036 RepID=UPI00340323D7
MALGPEIRPVLASTLRSYAAALQSDRDDESADGAAEAVSGLADAVRAAHRSSGDDLFVAAALIVALRRGVDALGAGGSTAAAGRP